MTAIDPIHPIVVEPNSEIANEGLTLRQHFAIQILAGLVVDLELPSESYEPERRKILAKHRAEDAVLLADALIAELKK
jgi:hypothetical protein